MKTRCMVLALCLFASQFSFSQTQPQSPTEEWDLRKCVEYALVNNISVRQADLQVRFARLDLQQSKLQQYPNANYSTSVGLSAGRNQDPTNFSLITSAYVFNNHSLQASADVFNWFSKKNTVKGRELSYEATRAGFEKAQNDVSLNVAVAYLQALLAKEQANIAAVQVLQTISQLESTRKQVDAGKIPEINASQLETQVALDSSALITSQTLYVQNVLQLKALLNLDAAAPFAITTPPVDRIPVEPIGELLPDEVYNMATTNLPQQRIDSFNVAAANKYVKAAKGSMYPTFSIFGSLGTSFNNKSQQAVSKSLVISPIGNVTIGNDEYEVLPIAPFERYQYGKIAYGDQLNQNFRQSIGLNLSVPIFNGGTLRTAWNRSKLNLQQAELTREQNSMTLKQDIYKAYNDATAALQKYNANRKAVETAQRTYDFAMKRFDVGLLSTYDLITTQNNLTRAKYDMVYTQYDYVFKIKLLEFYKGLGIKL